MHYGYYRHRRRRRLHYRCGHHRHGPSPSSSVARHHQYRHIVGFFGVCFETRSFKKFMIVDPDSLCGCACVRVCPSQAIPRKLLKSA